jgi:hypothetical protein
VTHGFAVPGAGGPRKIIRYTSGIAARITGKDGLYAPGLSPILPRFGHGWPKRRSIKAAVTRALLANR